MSKKSFARLVRIVTGAFSTAGEEAFSFEASLTRFEKFIHFWVLVWRSYLRNRCPVRAAALSYTTLLALIPMLAVAMSLTSFLLKSKGEEQIGAFIDKFIAYLVPDAPAQPNALPDEEELILGYSLPQAAGADQSAGTNGPPAIGASSLVNDARVVAAKDRAAGQIKEFLQNAHSKSLGTVGGLLLFWTGIMMLIRMEETFNDIWGVRQGRDWWPRITNYFFTIMLGPVLIIAAVGLATGSRFQKTREFLGLMPFVEPLISQLLPVVMISITFALIYKLMPNTKVHFSAALVGGLLAGTAWHVFNLFSLYLSSRAVNASKIYGSLALVPLLMVGLYVVWVIVLLGAQVAYAFQNRESYLQERLAENVNQRGREFVALRLMTCIGQHFHHGQPAATVTEMARELGIPSKLVQQVLQTLVSARLVVEVAGADPAYAPARPLDAINCHHVLLAMRATQGQELITREELVREEVFGEFARIQAAEEAAASTVSMLALVNRAQARLEITAPVEPEKATDPALTPVMLTELPHEPTTATATAPEAATPGDIIVKETKPVSPANINSAAPTAGSSTDDNQSFPL